MSGDNLVDASPRRLHPDLPDVGPLAFGCWRLTGTDADRDHGVVKAALDAGMNLVDTADVYGLDWGGRGFGANEEVLGRVLADDPSLRERMVLATKGGIIPGVPYDSSADYLRRAVDASRRRLEVDAIDVWMVHRPDPFTHPAELAETMAALVGSGAVRAVGVSNYSAAQYDALVAHLDVPLATNQVELSAARPGAIFDGTLDRCTRDGVTPTVWSPLAGGRIVTGEGVAPALLAVLDELAQRERADRAAVGVAFTLTHPSRPVTILGTQRPERIAAATSALGAHLDRADVYRILAAAGVPLP